MSRRYSLNSRDIIFSNENAPHVASSQKFFLVIKMCSLAKLTINQGKLSKLNVFLETDFGRTSGLLAEKSVLIERLDLL